MSIAAQIAKHLRDVHFGGNWTTTNLKEVVKNITWQQAITRVHSFNTIAILVYHTGYFVEAQLRVLRGEPLNAKDSLSFSHPPIQSEADWQSLLNKTWSNAEQLAVLVEAMPDNQLNEPFENEKYGNYYRNLQGQIEHMHYHLGQIVIIKKLVQQLQ